MRADILDLNSPAKNPPQTGKNPPAPSSDSQANGATIAGEKAALEKDDPAGIDETNPPNSDASAVSIADQELLPAFLSLPLFSSGSWLAAPEASPNAEKSDATPAVSTASTQPDQTVAGLTAAAPAAATSRSQNSASLQPADETDLPPAKPEPDGLPDHGLRKVVDPVIPAQAAAAEKNGAGLEAAKNSAATGPKEKADRPELQPESGRTLAEARSSEGAVAQVAMSAEPSVCHVAADSALGDATDLNPGAAPMPGGQTVTVSSGASEQAAENAGTGVASMVPSMKNPQNANKVAGSNAKVLPVGENGEAAAQNLPQPQMTTARAADNRGPDVDFAFADGGSHAPAAESTRVFNVLDLPSLAEARTRALDRALDMMALHSMRLVESRSDVLSVVIKPAVGTELSLELRQHAGGVAAQAMLLRGDREFLSQHWPDLQQRLEQRGIKLAPLGGAPDLFANDNGQFPRPQTSQEDAAQQASAFAEFAAAVPAGGATARLASVHDGWESWA